MKEIVSFLLCIIMIIETPIIAFGKDSASVKITNIRAENNSTFVFFDIDYSITGYSNDYCLQLELYHRDGTHVDSGNLQNIEGGNNLKKTIAIDFAYRKPGIYFCYAAIDYLQYVEGYFCARYDSMPAKETKIKFFNIIKSNAQLKVTDYNCLRQGHIYLEGAKVIKKPTVFKKGTAKKICSECGKIQYKNISKLKPKISLSKKKKSLYVGKKFCLKVSMRRGDTIKKIRITNKKVIKIKKIKNKITIKAKKKGKSNVIVYLKSGKKSKCKIRVFKKQKNKRNLYKDYNY